MSLRDAWCHRLEAPSVNVERNEDDMRINLAIVSLTKGFVSVSGGEGA
jgi:hypothetical protein